MQKWLLRPFMNSTNSSIIFREQKRTLRPFADSMIFALDGCVQKRTLRPFADSTIFALDCRVQKFTLCTNACETAVATCKEVVQNSHHRLKQSRPCKTFSACKTIFLSFCLSAMGTNSARERQYQKLQEMVGLINRIIISVISYRSNRSYTTRLHNTPIH